MSANNNDELIRSLELKLSRMESKNKALSSLYEHKCEEADMYANSTCWKITAPLRAVGDLFKGIKHSNSAVAVSYQDVDNRFIFSKKQLAEQKKDRFPRDITISIIVPLYNTSENYLREMLESVRKQTYSKWELCIADGSDAEHRTVGRICKDYAQRDKRIKYKKLDKNSGISGNTNACLQLSTGEYIALLDHDDILHPAALHEVMEAICEGDADFIYTDEAVFTKKPEDAYVSHFKPDYAPDSLLANNYICHFTVFSRKILETIGGFRIEYDGSQDHDFVLRATAAADCIAHIPEVLYFWRSHPDSVAGKSDAKPYAAAAGIRAAADHIRCLGREAVVTSTETMPTIYRFAYKLEYHPKISVIIPNYEHLEELRKCLESIISKTTYDNYEILIVENNSQSKEIFDYYERLQSEHRNIRVITWTDKFNYSAVCNFGARNCNGSILLFLNNDTEIITPEWLEEMLMYAQRKDVGAVGAKLYYPDDTIQHAGVLLGCGGFAGHYFPRFDMTNPGYMDRLSYVQNHTAVTGACLMISRTAFECVKGFDEELAVALNDIDLCMKLRDRGYLNIWTPFAELYHYESLSRGYEDTLQKKVRFEQECRLFIMRWWKEIRCGDPYYNPNLNLDGACFLYKQRSQPYHARFIRKDKLINS